MIILSLCLGSRRQVKRCYPIVQSHLLERVLRLSLSALIICMSMCHFSLRLTNTMRVRIFFDRLSTSYDMSIPRRAFSFGSPFFSSVSDVSMRIESNGENSEPWRFWLRERRSCLDEEKSSVAPHRCSNLGLVEGLFLVDQNQQWLGLSTVRWQVDLFSTFQKQSTKNENIDDWCLHWSRSSTTACVNVNDNRQKKQKRKYSLTIQRQRQVSTGTRKERTFIFVSFIEHKRWLRLAKSTDISHWFFWVVGKQHSFFSNGNFHDHLALGPHPACFSMHSFSKLRTTKVHTGSEQWPTQFITMESMASFVRSSVRPFSWQSYIETSEFIEWPRSRFSITFWCTAVERQAKFSFDWGSRQFSRLDLT